MSLPLRPSCLFAALLLGATLSGCADTPPALDGIARRYGRATAYGVALVFEYPGFKE